MQVEVTTTQQFTINLTDKEAENLAILLNAVAWDSLPSLLNHFAMDLYEAIVKHVAYNAINAFDYTSIELNHRD